MKKYLLLVAVLFSVTAFAQETLSEGLQAKNAGNDAYRNKEWVKAITEYEKYFKSGEEGAAEDANTQTLYVNSFKYAASDYMQNKQWESAFNYYQKYIEKGGNEAATDGKNTYAMAYCANKMNKNDVAMSYYQKTIELGYRPDMCKLYIADIYKEAGEETKMKDILVAAITEHPDSKVLDKMKSMLTVPMLKEASVPFNQANELAKQASAGAPTEYVEKMGLAITKFEEAIPLFENVLKYDPTNELANTYLKASQDNIKSFNDYKASIKK